MSPKVPVPHIIVLMPTHVFSLCFRHVRKITENRRKIDQKSIKNRRTSTLGAPSWRSGVLLQAPESSPSHQDGLQMLQDAPNIVQLAFKLAQQDPTGAPSWIFKALGIPPGWGSGGIAARFGVGFWPPDPYKVLRIVRKTWIRSMFPGRGSNGDSKICRADAMLSAPLHAMRGRV